MCFHWYENSCKYDIINVLHMLTRDVLKWYQWPNCILSNNKKDFQSRGNRPPSKSIKRGSVQVQVIRFEHVQEMRESLYGEIPHGVNRDLGPGMGVPKRKSPGSGHMGISLSADRHDRKHYLSTTSLAGSNFIHQQESIPVGCVPSTCTDHLCFTTRCQYPWGKGVLKWISLNGSPLMATRCHYRAGTGTGGP